SRLEVREVRLEPGSAPALGTATDAGSAAAADPGDSPVPPGLGGSPVRHPALGDVLLPLVEQRPADGAGAEVGHVLVLAEAVDGLLQDAVVAAEDRPVAGQQELSVVAVDAAQRLEELGDVGAVVGVDGADAAVLVDVVPAEQQVTHLETELAGG